MGIFNVVYITDENYAMPTCVSIISLLCSNTKKNHFQIYVLMDNTSRKTKQKFEMLQDKYVICNFIDINSNKYKQIVDICTNTYVTKTALFKFDIANILNGIDKVLYLDGDILIRKDISELFEIDLSDYYLAAVDDMGDTLNEKGESELAQRIGVEKGRYFNSGVMLLNLDKMRKEQIGGKLLKFRSEQTNYFMDQDAFNKIMGMKRFILPYQYNFRTALFDNYLMDEISSVFFGGKYNSVEECLCDQAIIHMTARYKPWKYKIPWISDLFLYYYNKSPYRNYALCLLSPLKELNDKWMKDYAELLKIHEKLYKKFRITIEDKRKVWKFPYSKIEKGSRVILYGAGQAGQDMYNQIRETDYCQLALWVDKNWINMEHELIVSPEMIQTCVYDYVIIAISAEDVVLKVEEFLKSIGVSGSQIVKMKK